MGRLGLAVPMLIGLSLTSTTAAAGPLIDPAPWVLPVNAYAKARAGDWTLLEGDAVLNGRMVREREIIRVVTVARGVAEVQLFEGAEGREGWILTFPVDVKRGPDTNLLYDVPWVATDMVQAKASCMLGDATFACTKITYRTLTNKVTVFMAPRVRGSGIVAFEVLRRGKPVWRMTTIGYGHGDVVEWGVGPPRADLEAWDGGAIAVDMRDGSEPATDDVYEPEAALDPGAPAPRKKARKPRLISKGHPARGGPDLRGLKRIP